MAVKAWRKVEPSLPQLPIPWNLVVLLFQLGVAKASAGRGVERVIWILHPLMWVVSFLAPLRPGECCSRSRGDITLSSDLAICGGHEAVLRLVAARIKRALGLYLFALVKNPELSLGYSGFATSGDQPGPSCLQPRSERLA